MNCHYVPQFYLRNFSISGEDGYIFAYQRNRESFKTQAKSVAAKNDLYVFTDKSGKKNDEIEKMFSHLEGDCKPIIDKLIKDDTVEILNDEKILLSHFIAFLHIRNLSFMEKQKNTYSAGMKKILELQASNKEVFKNGLKESGADVNLNDDKEIEELRKSVLDFDKHYKIGFSKDSDDYFMASSMEHGLALTPYVLAKKWCLFNSDSNRVFVTSDNPVILVRPEGLPPFYGCGFANSHIYLPLTEKKSLFLSISTEHPEVVDLKREDVDFFNRHIMFFAHKFIYSNIQSQDLSNAFNETTEGESEKVIVS